MEDTPKVEIEGDRTYIDHALLQNENEPTRTIAGKVFDISDPRYFGKVLSSKDKLFYSHVQEFNFGSDILLKEFVEYLLTADVLISIRAYGTVAYYPRGAERSPENAKTYHTNHGSEEILSGIQSGRWDPSDVLFDLATLYKLAASATGKKAEGERIFSQAKELILKGYEVKVPK